MLQIIAKEFIDSLVRQPVQKCQPSLRGKNPYAFILIRTHKIIEPGKKLLAVELDLAFAILQFRRAGLPDSYL